MFVDLFASLSSAQFPHGVNVRHWVTGGFNMSRGRIGARNNETGAEWFNSNIVLRDPDDACSRYGKLYAH